MNQLLSKALAILNGFIAFLFILGGAFVGDRYAPGPVFDYYVIIGSLIGFLLAVLFCGIVALFISIHGELQQIRKKMDDLSQ